MKVSIRNGVNDKQRQIINESGMLCGLLSEVENGSWRVEMLMKYDVKHSNYDRAIGFAFGIAAATP